jgi:hypothetical protein
MENVRFARPLRNPRRQAPQIGGYRIRTTRAVEGMSIPFRMKSM